MENIGIWINSWNLSSTVWIWFLIFGVLTLITSMKMVNYAQLIIQKTKLGGAFVGLIFVSLITSIPELITEISQGILGKPDVGISDDIGSNAFSMFALSFVILIFIKKLYIDKISKLTIITIFISLTLSIFVTFVFKYQLDYNVGYAGTFSVGITSIFLLFCYLIFVFFTYKNRHLADPEPKILIKSNKTIKQIFILFIFYSIFLILVAISLNASVNAMQHQYKISSKSAGGLFLSITTSMPEIIALIVFAKSGFLSAAISSIVGSHIFNLSAIFWGDVAFVDNASILFDGVQNLWVLSLIATIEIFLFLIFIYLSKKTKNKLLLSLIPLLIIIIYILSWILLMMEII